MRQFFISLHLKTRFWIAVGGVTVCVAAFSWFAFFVLLGRVRGESAEIEAAKIRRASIEARRAGIKREKAALVEAHADAERLERYFAQSPLALFEFLEALASRSNLSIILALDGENGAGRPERLRVAVDGTYRNLLRFTRGLESAPYAFVVQSIDATMANQQPVFSDSRMRFIINLRVVVK